MFKILIGGGRHGNALKKHPIMQCGMFISVTPSTLRGDFTIKAFMFFSYFLLSLITTLPRSLSCCVIFSLLMKCILGVVVFTCLKSGYFFPIMQHDLKGGFKMKEK